MNNIKSNYIIAVVVSALIYGGIIYLSRFVPLKIGTIQIIYPAAIIAPLLGIWFRFWGSLGLVIGNMLSMFLVGLNPLIFPLALLGQFVMGFIPCLLFWSETLDHKRNLGTYIFAVIMGQVAGTSLVALNLVLFQGVPLELVWKTIWPWMQVSNTLMAAIFSPFLFKIFASYMQQSGLMLKKIMG